VLGAVGPSSTNTDAIVMRNRGTIPFSLLLACSLALSVVARGQAPIVHKIEPPNWWSNFTPELSLLVTGEHLSSAQVESATAGAAVLDSQSSANGHYLFVHVRLSPNTPSGTVNLRLTTSGGTAAIRLPLLTRSDTKGRFKGVSRDDVIYLIMPDRFADGDPNNDQPEGSIGKCDRANPMAYHGGDLRGIDQHLSYLHNLGVTTLWLTPVWKNTDSDYHGYHVVDLYALDAHMGSMEDYENLVADAHKLGMKVLIDFVANHTGPHHPWANDQPTSTWFHGSPAHHLEPAYSFSGLVDPHASPRESRRTLEGWFAGKLPDLNPDDPLLERYLVQNALWWTELAQLDGFRIDTFPYSSRQFWSQWSKGVAEVYPRINSIGEVADADPTITSFFEGGRKQFDGIDTGLSTVFDFPMEEALREVIIGGAPIQRIIDVLQRDDLYPHPEMLVTFIGNHDHTRFISEKGSDATKLKAAFSLLLTLRGIPQIYSGDEIGMPGGPDPDNRHDFPGGFPGDPRNAFTAGGRTPEQQDVFAHVQSLMALRREHPALRTGKQWHIGWDETYYAFLRELPEEKLLVVYNNSSSSRNLNIPLGDTSLENVHDLESVFGGISASIQNNEVRLQLGPQSIAVFKVRQ